MNDARDKMIELLHGVLDDADRAAFELSVAESPTLQAEWNAIRQAASRLLEFVDSLTAPPDLADRTHRLLIQWRESRGYDPLHPERAPE
jgi:hypothetical protein